MLILNFIVLKLFLVSIFFNYVYAQNALISTKAIYYNVSHGSKSQYMCLSITWLPFDVQEENCKKESNVFRGNVAQTRIDGIISICNGYNRGMLNEERKYVFKNYFDNKMLHQISYLCGVQCADLVPEVNLDRFWEKIVAKERTKEFRQKLASLDEYATNSICPFSTRIDVQWYLFNRHVGHDHEYEDKELCVDRYGRKYPPPEGLGGKCVVFQHEFKNVNGEQVTELFMPIEKRDMVQRLLQYPYTHHIRQNETTLNRLLPEEDNLNETDCLTLHHGEEEMFFHCRYNPNDSRIFQAKGKNDFDCAKNVYFLLNFTVQENNSNMYIYTLQPVTADYHEFSDNCYVSIQFIPEKNKTATIWNDPRVPLTLNNSLEGGKKSNCPTDYYVSDVDDYEYVMKEALKDLCPWDKDMSYTLCFKIQAKGIMQDYKRLAGTLFFTPVFNQCFFQSSLSEHGCYVIVDPVAQRSFRMPASWIKALESDSLITSPKLDWNKAGPAAAFVFFNPEVKKECAAKLDTMTTSPVANISLDLVKYYFASHSKQFVARCEEPYCDDPRKGDEWVRRMQEVYEENPLNCYEGIRDKGKSIDTVETNSSYTFFCSVFLSVYYEDGKKLRKYNFSHNVHKTHPVEPKNCWDSVQLSSKMKDPEAVATKIDSCHHDFKSQTVYCCCLASKEPCNKAEIVDEFYDIANTDAEETRRRIQEGCRFDANISLKNEETCRKETVRHDREMRCYGVFQIPSTNNKPKLIKENCYWPHPQYHDRYSIFCSRHFFENDDELVNDKCISLFINDFTTRSTAASTPSTTTTAEKKINRTLILCCNTGVYAEKRESILSRSVVLL